MVQNVIVFAVIRELYAAAAAWYNPCIGYLWMCAQHFMLYRVIKSGAMGHLLSYDVNINIKFELISKMFLVLPWLQKR